jgi:hypothetical protein
MSTPQTRKQYNVGNLPPEVHWTVVRGDTAAFKVYVTDDLKQPLNIPDWSIKMDIKRGATLLLTLRPEQDPDDAAGEFTVFLDDTESEILETGDVFDIQLTDPTRVWTVAQGAMVIIEDVTEPEGS